MNSLTLKSRSSTSASCFIVWFRCPQRIYHEIWILNMSLRFIIHSMIWMSTKDSLTLKSGSSTSTSALWFTESVWFGCQKRIHSHWNLDHQHQPQLHDLQYDLDVRTGFTHIEIWIIDVSLSFMTGSCPRVPSMLLSTTLRLVARRTRPRIPVLCRHKVGRSAGSGVQSPETEPWNKPRVHRPKSMYGRH